MAHLRGQPCRFDSYRLLRASRLCGDLNNWIPFNGKPMVREIQGLRTAWAFPALSSFSALFNVQAGETLLPETAKFGSPALPIGGLNYSAGSTSTSPLHGVRGECPKGGRPLAGLATIALCSLGSPRRVESVTFANPVSMPFDTTSLKSRPFIVQDGNTAIIFYSAATTSGGQILWTSYDGANWTMPQAIALPSGFESANAPTVAARPYTGDPTNFNLANALDVSFTGRLHGRSVNEVFMIRLGTNASPPVPQSEAFVPLPSPRNSSRRIAGTRSAALWAGA